MVDILLSTELLQESKLKLAVSQISALCRMQQTLTSVWLCCMLKFHPVIWSISSAFVSL